MELQHLLELVGVVVASLVLAIPAYFFAHAARRAIKRRRRKRKRVRIHRTHRRLEERPERSDAA